MQNSFNTEENNKMTKIFEMLAVVKFNFFKESIISEHCNGIIKFIIIYFTLAKIVLLWCHNIKFIYNLEAFIKNWNLVWNNYEHAIPEILNYVCMLHFDFILLQATISWVISCQTFILEWKLYHLLYKNCCDLFHFTRSY